MGNEIAGALTLWTSSLRPAAHVMALLATTLVGAVAPAGCEATGDASSPPCELNGARVRVSVSEIHGTCDPGIRSLLFSDFPFTTRLQLSADAEGCETVGLHVGVPTGPRCGMEILMEARTDGPLIRPGRIVAGYGCEGGDECVDEGMVHIERLDLPVQPPDAGSDATSDALGSVQ